VITDDIVQGHLVCPRKEIPALIIFLVVIIQNQSNVLEQIFRIPFIGIRIEKTHSVDDFIDFREVI